MSLNSDSARGMNSCFEALDFDELHCATEVTGGARSAALTTIKFSRKFRDVDA
jgi:hypothetical protein